MYLGLVFLFVFHHPTLLANPIGLQESLIFERAVHFESMGETEFPGKVPDFIDFHFDDDSKDPLSKPKLFQYDDKGLLPIHSFALQGDVKMTSELIGQMDEKYGRIQTLIMESQFDGRNILQLSILSTAKNPILFFTLLPLYLEQGIDIFGMRDKGGDSILHLAAAAGKIEIMHSLLNMMISGLSWESGFVVTSEALNVRNKFGLTVLHLALIHHQDRLSLIHLLSLFGSNPYALDMYGRTPWSLADPALHDILSFTQDSDLGDWVEDNEEEASTDSYYYMNSCYEEARKAKRLKGWTPPSPPL